MRSLVRVLCLLALSIPVQASEVPEILRAHEDCVDAGRSSGVCAEVLTGYCLDNSDNFKELTRCRAAMAEALEVRAVALADQIGRAQPAQRARAAEILAGSERIVAAYCSAYAGRMKTDDSASHDIRCALMTGHVKVYHLLRLKAGRKDDI